MAKKIKRMIWDIETSPNVGYFWRPGYKVRIGHENIIKERAIICICWKWEGQKTIHSLTWDGGDDRAMIKQFLKVAEKADEMIAHNGDQFDLTWFQGRCLKHGFDPTPVFVTVDTLCIARRHFNLNSYSLEYLGQYLLGEGKMDTGGFGLWKAICKIGGNQVKKDAALNKMVRYCKKDVDVLERVWDRIKSFAVPRTHAGVLAGHDRWTCPYDGTDNVVFCKARVTAAGMKRHQFRCKDCGRYFTVPSNIYNKYVEAHDD